MMNFTLCWIRATYVLKVNVQFYGKGEICVLHSPLTVVVVSWIVDARLL